MGQYFESGSVRYLGNLFSSAGNCQHSQSLEKQSGATGFVLGVAANEVRGGSFITTNKAYETLKKKHPSVQVCVT